MKHALESEKKQLCSKTDTLQMVLEVSSLEPKRAPIEGCLLQELEQEKEKIRSSLSQEECEKAKLSKENQQLSVATQNLQHELKKIESRTTLLQKEKALVEAQ